MCPQCAFCRVTLVMSLQSADDLKTHCNEDALISMSRTQCRHQTLSFTHTLGDLAPLSGSPASLGAEVQGILLQCAQLPPEGSHRRLPVSTATLLGAGILQGLQATQGCAHIL